MNTTRSGSGRTLSWHASALVLAAGLAAAMPWSARAQEGAPPPKGNDDPAEMPDPNAEKNRQEDILRQRDEARKRALQNRDRAGMPRDPTRDALGNAIVNPEGAPAEAVEGLNPIEAAMRAAQDGNPPADGSLRLSMQEALDLAAFAAQVSEELGINIIADPSLAGKSVLLRSPIELRKDQLLPLLSRLVEDQGFILTKDPVLPDYYTIKVAANVPMGAAQGDALATTRVIATPLVKPSSLQGPLQTHLGGAATNVRMTAVDELGVMIVTGGPTTLDSIEQFVKTMLAEVGKQKPHRVVLTHVAAEFAIQRMLALNGKIAAGGSAGVPTFGAPATPGAIQATPAASTTGALSNLELRLFVDQGNSVVFMGTDEEFALVRTLIDMVDISTEELIAKRYATGPLAAQIAGAGQNLGLGGVAQTAGGTGGGGIFGAQTPASGTGSELRLGSHFEVDEEGGSIVYFGTATQHARVEALVKQFREQALDDEIVIQTYKLKYARAVSSGSTGVGGSSSGSDLSGGGSTSGFGSSSSSGLSGSSGSGSSSRGVVDILLDLLEDPSQVSEVGGAFLPGSRSGVSGGRSDLGLPIDDTAPPTDAEGATTLIANRENTIITADEAQNMIIIKAPKRAQRQFAALIDQLDKRRPQVMLKAQIVSVAANDSFNFAADVQLNAGQWSFLSTFGLTQGATGGDFSDPRVVPANAQQGVTTAFIKSDFVPFVINALQTVGDTRIVSSPNVTVSDNALAEVVSLREEPFQTTTVTQGNPTITGQGGTAEAGTTLKVRPTTNSGGDLTLEYSIELSDFDRANATSGLQPPKQKEQYNSVVTIPANTTVVVGGFTLETTAKTTRKIPLLGDIPLLGLMFQSITEAQRRTTIFVFITPVVMDDENSLLMKLYSQGPLAEAGIDPLMPEMEFVRIPIDLRGSSRLLPSDRVAGAEARPW